MLEKFKQGYASMLGVSPDVMDKPGITFVVTPLRQEPEWANYVFPIWFFAFGDMLICSIAPAYAEQTKVTFANLKADALLHPETLALAHSLIEVQPAVGQEWVQCELFCYPHAQPPALTSVYPVEKLQPIDERSARFLRSFDGGVYAIRDHTGYIAAHAGIKNKGLIQEIAVGTEAGYQRRGLGKAVVASAVAEILRQGKVATYWPDSVENKASYALAHSLGFEKVAEMLFFCYELPN
jgi:GNAT superfamily N-acetyltransferase